MKHLKSKPASDFKPLRHRRQHRRLQAFLIAAVFACGLVWLVWGPVTAEDKPDFAKRNHHRNAPQKVLEEPQKTPSLLVQAAQSILAQDAAREAKRVGRQTDIPLEDIVKDIDLLQAQFLDFLNGEEGMQASDPRIFGGALQNLSEPFDIQFVWIRIHRFALHVAQSKSLDRTEFLQMGRIGRANLIAYTILYDKTSIIPFLESSYDSGLDLEAQLYVLVQDLTSVLYPWMSPTFNSIKEMQSRYSMAKSDGMVREGIIFTTGKWHFELTLHAIVTLRRVINCSLPIEVHYGGPEDLSPDMIDTFNALPNTVAVDTVSNFFTSETSQFGGWSLKPFALLASSFTRVIFIDADALFFQDPQTLLHSFTFQKHGQVFFHDRSLFRDDPVTWFREINPQYSHYASTLRYMNGLSWHEMESGVVVIDKSISGNLHALLMICNMNSKEERDAVTYKKMHGDKETYWISFDILRVPYAFVPTFGGTVGYKNETTGGICGGLFHTDENMKPLWWNGGVVANKWHSKDSTFMKFEYAAFDTDGDKIKWVWETPKTPFCLTPRYKWEVIQLGSREKSFGNKFVEIYKDMQNTGWKRYLKERMNVNID